jgi:hypothetical protein
MRSVISALLWCGTMSGAGAPPQYSYLIAGDEPGAWPEILASISLVEGSEGAKLIVIPAGATAPPETWVPRLEQGALLVLEGESPLAEALGFRRTGKKAPVQSVIDPRRPELRIIWESALDLPSFTIPPDAVLFSKERWKGTPLMAGVRRGSGAALWLAASPGRQGHERFPYLLQALAELGLKPPLKGNRLWAFFDSAYRARVDPDYFAARWRRSGVAALHVAAWHYFDPDPQRDEYLRNLIEACHRQAILVYAWFEFPHVSEQFWKSHPEWREKTALLQDAHLDWRKLMNLENRDCFRAAGSGLHALMDRFDWDGINLAELYFESLEGVDNPARFTPMNDDVRAAFRAEAGFDPIEIFRGRKDGTAAYLDFRARLAAKMQGEWLDEVRAVRRRKPHLEAVLTHVDDRFDTRMRELIGADAARLLPLLERHDFTFLVEDPATIWHLGPQRYPRIAEKYAALTPHSGKLAIDINVVERYQDVYPTKQQTGVELFQLVHVAAKAFPRVALYFENSILKQDLDLLPAATATVDRLEQAGSRLVVESRHGVGVPWSGAAKVNGMIWPVSDGETLWLAPGLSAIEPALAEPSMRILYFNGGLKTASAMERGIEVSYESSARAMAMLDRRPGKLEIDGFEEKPRLLESAGGWVLLLPRGQHVINIGAGD